MAIAYLDCFAGISGDMALGALLAAGLPAADLQAMLENLPLSGYHLEIAETCHQGLRSTRVNVAVKGPPWKEAPGLEDIRGLILNSRLPAAVKEASLKVYQRLAEAEARVHGRSLASIHFHEVGAVDSIVDIVGVCAGFFLLRVERLYCSPLPLGRGLIASRHGNLPLPAPAALEALKGIPVYGDSSTFELVTPTGAALVSVLAHAYGPMPCMRVTSIGYGAGQRSLPDRPNLLRLIMGEPEAAEAESDRVICLETNIDDMNPQFYEHVMQRLMEAGALDVFLEPVQMKKNRPGTLLRVLGTPENYQTLAGILIEETTTLGVRYTELRRITVKREIRTVQTDFGPVRVKMAYLRGRYLRSIPEYEDCRKLAVEKGVPLVTDHEQARLRALERGL